MRCSGHAYLSRSNGSTLLELLIVVAILGIVGAVTGLALRPTSGRPVIEPSSARIGDARRAAIRGGRSVTVTVLYNGRAVVATAHADGSVLADSSVGIDRLSGRAAR